MARKASDFCPMFGTDGMGQSAVEEWDMATSTFTGASTFSSTLAVTGAATFAEDVTFSDAIDPQYGRRHTYFEIFDDFVYQTLTVADTPWIALTGSDDACALAATVGTNPANGVIVLTAGDGDGSYAQDGSQLSGDIPVMASYGNLVFETRLCLNTAITGISVNAGFTDVQTLEEPFSIATATVTSNASDAACFVFDDGATSKTWWACAVDGNTDDTGNATTGSAPVADTYQVLRIEINATGTELKFYVDGTLKKTLSAAGISPDVALYPIVCVCGTGNTAAINVDYIYVGHTRA